jgi:hypothetical protein
MVVELRTARESDFSEILSMMVNSILLTTFRLSKVNAINMSYFIDTFNSDKKIGNYEAF